MIKKIQVLDVSLLVFKVFINTFKTTRSVLYVIVLSKFFTRRIEKYSDKCIVLGNAPSLDLSIEEIKKHLKTGKCSVICVNNFLTSKYFEELKPEQCVILDPNYWRKTDDEAVKAMVQKFHELLEKKVTWSLVLNVPKAAEKVFNNNKYSNENINIRCFNKTPLDGYEVLVHWMYKHRLGMPVPYNVLVAAIIIALNDGYKNIKIYGADHSWHNDIIIGDDNRVMVKQEHFYDKSNVKYLPIFVNQRGLEFNMSQLFVRWGKVFESYYKTESYAKYLNASIVNCTPGSFIDAFKRQS